MEEYDVFEEYDDAFIDAFFADEDDEDLDTPVHEPEVGNNSEAASTSSSSKSAAKNSSTRTQKNKIPRPESKLKLQDVTAKKEDILKETVTNVYQDEAVSEDTFVNSKPVKAFAEKAQSACSSITAASLLQFEAILSILWPAIDCMKKKSTNAARQEATDSEFFYLRNDISLITLVNDFFKQLTLLSVPKLFVQIFLRYLHEKLVQLHEKIPKAAEDEPIGNLKQKEQNALRYVAGYIVSRIPRKITRKMENEAMLETVEKMKKDHDKDTRLSYTRTWVETQSRGGLCLINDNAFLFFESLEKIIKRKLPQSTGVIREFDIRKIAEFVLTDHQVLERWFSIYGSTSLSEHGGLVLLQLVVNFYVQIRGFAFAKNIVDKYKIHEKSKKSKSLRKEMKRSSTTTETTE